MGLYVQSATIISLTPFASHKNCENKSIAPAAREKKYQQIPPCPSPFFLPIITKACCCQHLIQDELPVDR